MNSKDAEMLYRVYSGLYSGANAHPMSEQERLRYNSLAQRGYLEVFIDGSMEITPQGLSAISDYEEDQKRKEADEREKLEEQSRVSSQRAANAVKDAAVLGFNLLKRGL